MMREKTDLAQKFHTGLVNSKFLNNVLVVPNYRTHTANPAEYLHQLSELILWFPHSVLHLLARVKQPSPGAYKDEYLQGLAIQSGAAIAFLYFALALWNSYEFRMSSLMFGIAITSTGYLLRAIDHQWRPLACYLVNTHKTKNILTLPKMNKKNPLHVRTHNVAFTPETIRIIADTRDPKERAKELADSIINDPKNPAVIFLQEASLFHEKAAEIFFTLLSRHYPYIIYNVENSIFGFFSGCSVVSRYPLKFEGFYPFQNIETFQSAAPRGILLISIQTKEGKFMIGNAHTQSFSGEKHAKARLAQLQFMYDIVKRRSKEENCCYTMVVGDLNTAWITEEGEDNELLNNQAEIDALEFINEKFEDPYIQDHDPRSGKRISGKPYFLKEDCQSLNDQKLKEPNGTWYHEKFPKPTPVSEFATWLARFFYRQQPSESNKTPSWGTKRWNESKANTTSRYDYILFPKIPGQLKLEAKIEIRHSRTQKQSAPSDHLAVDALINVPASPGT